VNTHPTDITLTLLDAAWGQMRLLTAS
jgi:hypothetical protein